METQKFYDFLESFKGKDQDALLESIKKGFATCMESSDSSKKVYLDTKAIHGIEGKPTTTSRVYLQNYDNGKPVLYIEGTPGHWYIETLAQHAGDILSIDGGQNWNVYNFIDISDDAWQNHLDVKTVTTYSIK